MVVVAPGEISGTSELKRSISIALDAKYRSTKRTEVASWKP